MIYRVWYIHTVITTWINLFLRNLLNGMSYAMAFLDEKSLISEHKTQQKALLKQGQPRTNVLVCHGSSKSRMLTITPWGHPLSWFL